MTRTVAELGAGLSPARASRPIAARRADPHPRDRRRRRLRGGAARARPPGRSSRAAIRAGRRRTRRRSRRVGIPIAWSHHAAHVTDGPRPDRLAVTKALTAIAPDHPELRAAAAPGHPGRALAAGHRGRRARPDARRRRRHARQEHDRGLAHLDPRRDRRSTRAPSSARCCPAALSGGIPATARLGQGRRRSSSRPTSTPATSTPTARTSSR